MYGSFSGVVEISPSVIAPVCQAGEQLELTCSTPSILHTWRLTANPESGAVINVPPRTVSSIGSTGVESGSLIINSTIQISFSRLSREGSLPLISRMIISPVSEVLNGTLVNCMDTIASVSAITTILIFGGRLLLL